MPCALAYAPPHCLTPESQRSPTYTFCAAHKSGVWGSGTLGFLGSRGAEVPSLSPSVTLGPGWLLMPEGLWIACTGCGKGAWARLELQGPLWPGVQGVASGSNRLRGSGSCLTGGGKEKNPIRPQPIQQSLPLSKGGWPQYSVGQIFLGLALSTAPPRPLFLFHQAQTPYRPPLALLLTPTFRPHSFALSALNHLPTS